MSNKPEIKGLFKKIKLEYLVVFALAVVAIFIVASSFTKSESASTSTADIDGYVSGLENKLKACLSKVNGAGKVEVIISIESGMQTILATEKIMDDKNTVETPIVVNGKTVVLKESYPDICGVIIVAEGAKNLSVKLNLLSAARVYLDIPQEKIEILAMK